MTGRPNVAVRAEHNGNSGATGGYPDKGRIGIVGRSVFEVQPRVISPRRADGAP
jgi:hypothetical protein